MKVLYMRSYQSALNFGLVALCLVSAALAQSYSITDLGTLAGSYGFAYDINNFSQKTGGSYLTGDTTRMLFCILRGRGCSI